MTSVLKKDTQWKDLGRQGEAFEDGGRDWSYAGTDQGIPGTTGNWKRQEWVLPENL